MRGMDAQTGGAYVYQWQCAMLLALNCFFEPAPDEPLFRLVTDFLGEVTEIHLEGEDRQRDVELEDINLIAGERRMLVQVKAKEVPHGYWTPSDRQLLKALYRFYDSRFLVQQLDETRFLFLTNRQFNKELDTIQQAIREDPLECCPEADKLFASLSTYAESKKRPPLEIGRFREMLIRTTLLKYLDEDQLRNAVQLTLRAYGRSDWQQAYSVLSDYFQWESTRKGGGMVTRASIIEKLGPHIKSGPSLPTPDQIQAHRTSLRERLDVDARRRWGGMSVYIQEEGAALPIEASPYETGRLGRRQNLLESLHAADRLLLLGEPGSGKTVALERLAWELCDGPEPAIPVLVRLFHYDGAALAEWIRSMLQGTGRLRLDGERALAAFLKEGAARCVFLFDGLNEVPPPYRDRLVGELVRWMATHPRHPVILTSRAQDELWRRLREEVRQAMVVQPISDEQAHAYLVDHLQERGDALYRQLDQRLQEMARIPLLLWLIKEAGAAGESIPGNRGELYARFVSRMLRRDTRRRMDAEIPERLKREALAGLAYHLGLSQRLTCPRDEAVGVVTQRLGEGLAEAVVGACARHGLLAGEEMVWFAPHQTVQEHFAALALADHAKQEWSRGAWGHMKRASRRLLTRQHQGLAGLAADDWWTETFVQLAGLADETDRLVREVARANPWLAWWCVEEGRDVSDDTRDWVEKRSAQLLRSERVSDRRRAVQALGQRGTERVVEPLFQAAGDDDPEIAGLAVQALAGQSESVRALAKEALQRGNRDLLRPALRYLSAQSDESLCAEIPWQRMLGQPMVWVPPGPFLMGSARDRKAHGNERPQHEVTLPGYWIGRYPVTVAQFRAFVGASGHRPGGSDIIKGQEEHPAVGVNWHDALAYCSWLGDKTGLPVTLPSEAEWEKAARGADGRLYPWGDDPPSDNLCNFDSPGQGTTPVGRYSPQGDSPYGCADMSGNVYEWTRSIYGGYPYDPGDGRENLEAEADVHRVLRGGAFVSSQGVVRCAYRYGDSPDFRDFYLGFRVMVAPVPSELWPSGL